MKLIIIFFVLSASAWGHDYSLKNPKHVINALQSFGLLKESKENFSEEEIRGALKNFQSKNGLKPTGDLNNETIAYLRKAHCGNHKEDDQSGFLLKRYNLHWMRFTQKKLSYCVHNYPKKSTLSNNEVLQAIRDAMDAWEPYVPIKFSYTQNCKEADLFFAFGKITHAYMNTLKRKQTNCRSGSAFKRSGGVLAHAYFPQDGNLHFDDNENWTEGTKKGVNLRLVVVHEMGHALGLKHSNARSAIMAPNYGGYIAKNSFKMPNDDIRGIKKLYYGGGGGGFFGRSIDEKRSESSLCSVEKIDAIFDFPDGYTYIIANGTVYRKNDDGIDKSFESRFSNLFEGVPDDIQGAMFSPKFKTLRFFSGTNIYYAKFKGKIDGLKFKKVTFKPKQGFTKASAAFAGHKDLFIYLVQEDMVYTLFIHGPHVRLSRKIKPVKITDLLDIDAAARAPPSVDGAYSKLGTDGREVFFFTGLSVYKGEKESNEGKLFISADYPKSFLTEYLNC